MNFEQREAQEQQGDSFETYCFVNDTDTWYYTSHNENIIIGAVTYIAVPIKRSSFNIDLVQGVVRCNVQARITTFFAQYIAAYPIIPTTVEINKYFMDDLTQGQLKFYGRVKGVTIQKEIANAECVSSMDELNRKLPRVFVQSHCNNALGDGVCEYVVADVAVTVLDISTDGSVLTLTNIAPLANWYGGYQYGIVTFNNDSRLVTRQVDDQVSIHFPFRDLAIGDAVTISIGCDKRAYVCRWKFNNLSNFVGMPYVPYGANPVEWGVD